jgi:hypothetical protein
MIAGPVLGSAMHREASWGRSNFFWDTFRCKLPNASLAACGGFDPSRTPDVAVPVVEGVPTIHPKRRVISEERYINASLNSREKCSVRKMPETRLISAIR